MGNEEKRMRRVRGGHYWPTSPEPPPPLSRGKEDGSELERGREGKDEGFESEGGVEAVFWRRRSKKKKCKGGARVLIGRKEDDRQIELGFRVQIPNCPSTYIYLHFILNSHIKIKLWNNLFTHLQIFFQHSIIYVVLLLFFIFYFFSIKVLI